MNSWVEILYRSGQVITFHCFPVGDAASPSMPRSRRINGAFKGYLGQERAGCKKGVHGRWCEVQLPGCSPWVVPARGWFECVSLGQAGLGGHTGLGGQGSTIQGRWWCRRERSQCPILTGGLSQSRSRRGQLRERGLLFSLVGPPHYYLHPGIRRHFTWKYMMSHHALLPHSWSLRCFGGSTTFPFCFSRVMGSPETLAKTLPFLSYARMIRILLLCSWHTVGDQVVLKELHFAFHWFQMGQLVSLAHISVSTFVHILVSLPWILCNSSTTPSSHS